MALAVKLLLAACHETCLSLPLCTTGTGDDWGSGGSNGSGGNGGGPLPDVNPVEALKRELGMQSNKLDPVVKERVEAAIARLGYRVTVGQVRRKQMQLGGLWALSKSI